MKAEVSLPELEAPRVTLVGESNPYGDDPQYALYPYPDGCSGHRLCRLVLGMNRRHYLASFKRVNLVRGDWSLPAARTRAAELRQDGGRFVLLGANVCRAFGVTFAPFVAYMQAGETLLCLPHPSGRCRLWQEPGTIEKARVAVAALAPWLAEKIGAVNGKT
jgi:hypothetical protein